MYKVILTLFLFPLIITSVSAQARYSPEFYGYGGISFPAGPDEFTDYWRMGFNFGGGIGVPVNPNLTLVGYVAYNTFRFDDDKFLRDYGFAGYGISISGGEASILVFSGNLKANLGPGGQVRPYLCGGGGFFRLSLSDITVYAVTGESETVEGTSETAFSILLGAGIEIPIGARMDLFAEGGYTIGFTEDESTSMFPVKLGIKFR